MRETFVQTEHSQVVRVVEATEADDEDQPTN